MEDLKNFQTTQIEEIYAIHFIYYPVKILNYGGVSSDKFPSDCMSESDYSELVDQSKFGTNIKLNESSIKGSVRSELIRFSFKLSPSLDTEDSTLKYSLIDVTFPKTYPSKSPYILIKMTMSMSSDDKRRFTSKLMQVIRDLNGTICIFEVSLFVNEIMSKMLSEDKDNIWDDITTREESEDNRINGEILNESSDHFGEETEYESGFLSQNEETLMSQYNENLEDSMGSEDINYKYAEMDFPNFPIWSVQSIVQSPLWYENFKGVDDENSGFEDKKLTSNVLKSNIPKLKLPIQTFVDEVTPQCSIGTKDQEDQTKSLLELDLSFNPEAINNINSIKKYLFEFNNDSYDRFDRDFVENDYLYQSTSLSQCSVRHVLDQNLYYIKIFHLPFLCPYVNLSNVDVRTILHSFRVTRRLVLNEIIARVSQLSKLEHNSICRYYQSWLEKKLNPFEVQKILKLCEEMLNSGSYSPLLKSETPDERMILLFKYFGELGEYFLFEMVTSRNLFIQIQNLNCHTLRYEIENNSLHKDEKLIWSFIRHLLDVLAYLHQNNVYHQSLSVDNIYVHTDVYGTGLKVSDFGITHLGRKLYACENECNRKSCECQEYRKSIRKYLYQSHPSSYGINTSLQTTSLIETVDINSFKNLRIQRTAVSEYNGFPGISQIKEIPEVPEEMVNGFDEEPEQLDRQVSSTHSSTGIDHIKSLSSLDFEDVEFEETFDPYAAIQEDMFALGLIIFRMWHPPIQEKAYHDLLVKVVSTRTFPDYFVSSTPPIIITTLSRLLTRDKRPTAIELLRETLVPPVMDKYMYKQYLRKLENPMSEESLDALKFLLSRDWRSDVSKYKHNYGLELWMHSSYVTSSLERFMRNRGVIIRPPLPLQVKTHENNDKLLVIDSTNTVFSVGGSIRQSLLRSFELYSGDDSGIGVKQFSIGDVYDEEKCVTGAVFSITIKIESDLNLPKSVGKKGFDYKNFDDNCVLMVSTQVDLILIAIESLESLNLGFKPFLTLTFQPLIVDFLTIVLNTNLEVASQIFSKLQTTDINEYTFNMLLEENSIKNQCDLKNLVDILSNRFIMIDGLKKLHTQVVNSTLPEMYKKDFMGLLEEIKKMSLDELVEGNKTQDNDGEDKNWDDRKNGYYNDNKKDNKKKNKTLEETKEKEENEKNNNNTSNNEIEDELVFERYYRRLLYLVEMVKMLQALELDRCCFIEFVLGSYYTEICDYCVNFPFFLCFMADERKNLVVTGGCYGTNTCFLEESNVSKILHFDVQYFIDDLIKLSIKDTKKIEGYSITPTKSDNVDVIITCQTTKLLPAAVSIANKLIDAGLSCECRAMPLILTGDFNLRLRMVESIKARVHLQKITNIVSDEIQTEKSQNENTDKIINEEEYKDKTHFNILYHVEPINGSFGQARKLDNEVALVHFIIGQLT